MGGNSSAGAGAVEGRSCFRWVGFEEEVRPAIAVGVAVAVVASFVVAAAVADLAARWDSFAVGLVEEEVLVVVEATSMRRWLPLLPVASAVGFAAAAHCTVEGGPAEAARAVVGDGWAGLEEIHRGDGGDDGLRGSDVCVFVVSRALFPLPLYCRCEVL